MVAVEQDKPSDDELASITPLEWWALCQARQVTHGQVTLFKRFGQIERVEKAESLKPPA